MALLRPSPAACRWCLLPMRLQGSRRRGTVLTCPRCDAYPTGAEPLFAPAFAEEEAAPEWRRERSDDL